MLFTKYFLLGLCFLSLTSHVFAQEDYSFEICEAITKQENPRILKGFDNWLFSRTDLISDIAITDEALLRLKELKAALDYRDMGIVFVLLPSRAMMHYDKFDLSQERFKNYDLKQAIESYEKALAVLRDVGFDVPNVYEYLLKNADGQDFSFKRDSHWLPNAAALTAEVVKETVVNTSVYEDLEISEFEAVLREVGVRDSDLARALNIQCKLSIPPEPQEIYQLESTTTQTDLFAENQTSLIPLWGTSYSQTSNFAEFLQAELDVDIVNYGYGAAGLWRSLRHYFLEQEIESDYAKLVVWEIPYGYFDEFDFLDLYQELIPTVYGACEGDFEVVQTVTKQLNQTKPVNILKVDELKFETPAWQAVRADLLEHDTEAVKMIFNGEKNPWLSHFVETDEVLSNKLYEFSVWLWTDGGQPQKVALTMFSGKDNVSVQNIVLTTEPKLYTVLHDFSPTEKTGFTVRIDGLKRQWSPNSAGSYLYALSPEIRQLESFEILDLGDKSILLDDDYYSYLAFEDMIIRDYQLVYEFEDGSSKVQTIERDIYSDNNGRFFYEMPTNVEAALNNIRIDGLMSSAVGNMSIQICRKPN